MKMPTLLIRFFLALLLFFFMGNIVHAQVDESAPIEKEESSNAMNNKKMEAIFKSEAEEIEGVLGNWRMLYGGEILIVLTDEKNNRMRIFTPVIEENKLGEGQLKKMLEANFHSALDSKYSLYEGYVISVFTHPLEELTNDQLIDAMRQVVVLSKTFGESYSSTGLIFAPQIEGGQEEEEKPAKKKLKKM